MPALESTSRNITYTYSNNAHINNENIGYGDKRIVFLYVFGTS